MIWATHQKASVAVVLALLILRLKMKKDWQKILGIGEMTLHDIIEELEKPGRDPRSEMPKPVLRTDVLEMKDLKKEWS